MPIDLHRKDNSRKDGGILKSDPVEITICLGSSCFARGNSGNLAFLEKYAKNHQSNVTIHLTGNLCQEQCSDGPNVKIGDTLYHHVTAAKLCELLQELDRSGHETT
jgi:NADH:ubiquinone oxidoreductase subunit E